MKAHRAVFRGAPSPKPPRQSELRASVSYRTYRTYMSYWAYKSYSGSFEHPGAVSPPDRGQSAAVLPLPSVSIRVHPRFLS